MSMFSPNMALAITEHSICHPGRPGPQGDGHDGSPGFEAFQSAKSAADRLPVWFESEPDLDVRKINKHGSGALTLPSL